MARFSKAAAAAFSAAFPAAYEAQSHQPLIDFETLYAGKIPIWAQQAIGRAKANIDIQISQAQVELNDPLEPYYVPAGTIFADALIEVGPPGSGELRQARVYTVLDMTYGDYIAELEAIMASWNKNYAFEGENESRILAPIWRIK